MFTFTISVSDIIIDALFVSALWQVISVRQSRKFEQRLEEELNELYCRIVEARDEAKKVKDKIND